ncbi:MAG: flagellar motor switch protein FliN [Phycisphaeraceae bacterium]|nr:flagellar motor switch protein FliN [Phycisphaeraceae bacterium]
MGEQLAEMDRDAAATAETAGVAAGAGPARAENATDDASPGVPELPEFDLADFGVSSKDIDLLSDVNLNVTIELGRTRMLIEDVLKLVAGAVIELDKLAGDPVDVFVNGRLVAKGEVLVLNDNFCVRVNEIVDAAAAEKA